MEYEPKLQSYIHVYIPEHQQLISFNTDTESDLFYDWWWTEGMDIYKKYVEANIV